jgi:uncharacterized protein (DUF433 family)
LRISSIAPRAALLQWTTQSWCQYVKHELENLTGTSTCAAVEGDPERVSGAWLFRGTRIPFAALFENLEDGALVSQFVEWFPGVTIEQARSVLEHAARSTLAPA